MEAALLVPARILVIVLLSVIEASFLSSRCLAACNVGDPSRAPQLVITSSPPDCCYAQQAGTVAGTVSNVDTEQVVVVVYALTDVYYVQPVVGATITPSCGGVWSTTTHGGAAYAAVLARRSWSPPALLTQLPAVEGPVLAVTRAPETQRRLDFAGQSWVVKSSGDVPFGPGPNLWSDSQENVWVDAEGLHLRLVERDGRWTCAEVMSEAYVAHGRMRFRVDGDIDAMDPNVVFGGFFYAAQGAEADIEWSRWGDASSVVNAQYAVQPDAVQPLSLTLGAASSTHEIVWHEHGVDFGSWAGAARLGSPPLASWSHAGNVGAPRFERMHFNLWLVDGAAPQAPVEVVIRSFESDTPSAVPEAWAGTGAPRLHVPTLVRDRLPYRLELSEPAAVSLRLYDLRGRLVREVVRGRFPAGSHQGQWNLAAWGIPMPRGHYFLRLQAGAAVATSRIVVLP